MTKEGVRGVMSYSGELCFGHDFGHRELSLVGSASTRSELALYVVGPGPEYDLIVRCAYNTYGRSSSLGHMVRSLNKCRNLEKKYTLIGILAGKSIPKTNRPFFWIKRQVLRREIAEGHRRLIFRLVSHSVKQPILKSHT
jgi:hypothetical protein